ncbi:MAG: preprotein translocase subunit SecE [Desulfatibacillaceae bacterium]|nr:preprotein translocase subunit SecE [Desulfatibacillaceae bacterium]
MGKWLSCGLQAVRFSERVMGKLLKKKTPEQKKKAREKAEVHKDDAEKQGASPASGAVAKSAPPPGGVQVRQPFKGPKFWAVTMQFLREVRMELKKVTWPSRRQTVGSTVVVIAFVLMVAAYLGLADKLLSSIIWMVLG